MICTGTFVCVANILSRGRRGESRSGTTRALEQRCSRRPPPPLGTSHEMFGISARCLTRPKHRPQLISYNIDISESSTSDCSHHRHTPALTSSRGHLVAHRHAPSPPTSDPPGRAAAFMIDGSAADPRRRPACSGRHTVTVHSHLTRARGRPSGPLVVPLRRR